MLWHLWTILRHVETRFRARWTVKNEISWWTVHQNVVDAENLTKAHHDDNKPPNPHYTKERCVGVLPGMYQLPENSDDYAWDTYWDISSK